ncbi:methyltransferase domain-containing protein [Nocardioides panacis]|uniref:Methyltransferase domain-containing protein n=1 Tax=Nocardioides panacis TaxID=2849501 RepID=A0A975XZA5_9ACTN|nr:methyltransferase domain-containing protein [Nocardioides panacis]QWZ07220.1 methyltransferase domain-containing protein [Nocardioides panacis]
MSDHKYDNEVQADNKFGHTLELLARHMPEDAAGGVHLDIACGFGHIAEPLVDAHGVHYVGIDVDEAGLADLRARGLEGHAADLSTDDATDALLKILDGRRLVSVTFLDGLEHLTDGSHALAAVGQLVSQERAVAVFSVPNVTHVDVAIKNLLGQWTYTEAGLLDATHYQLWSAGSLEAALRRAGLQKVDTYDVELARSDQHFPTDHVGLSESTTIGEWVRSVRRRADPHAITNQFVWAVTSVPPRSDSTDVRQVSDTFLSVIMRTQGRRPQELREALLCLAGQSNEDFEVVLVAHKTSLEEQKTVEQVIADQPPGLRSRIRLLLLDHGRRSSPLNLALAEARGRYVGIFDDDDIVMGHWVESFAAAERQTPGRILRGVTLRQDVAVAHVRALPGVRAVSSPDSIYTQDFSLTEHLAANQSPPIGWVFPRSLYLDFGIKFEESMTTTEDWEFLLRAAEIAGVADIPRVLAIYHIWRDRESSRTLHPQDEWLQNQQEIERRIDSQPFLLPAGETRKLRRELLRLRALETQTAQQQRTLAQRDRRIAQLEDRVKGLRERQAKVRGQLQRERRRRARLARQARRAGPAPATSTPVLGGLRRRLRLRTRAKALLGRAS